MEGRGEGTIPGGPGSSAGEGAIPEVATLVRAKPQTLRQKIWQAFNEPTSSRVGIAVAAFVVCMIALSVCAFIIQTLPEYVFSSDPAWTALEIFCVVVFTAELALRLWSCPSVKEFMLVPLNWVDVAAILPFYVEAAALGGSGGSSSAGIIRVLRLVRIFRIFKVARYLPWMRVFSRALLLSLQPLLMLVFVIMIGMVVFASGMYYAERGEYDAAAGLWVRSNPVTGEAAPSPFQSIPAAMWWALVTMSTVGYGDSFPITGPGKAIASLAALSGILVVAIPITVISTNFNAEYGRMERDKAKVRARLQLLQHHFSAKRAGLGAVLDEAEDLVRRNSQEFAGEVASLFEVARAELTSEIQEILRMAFERRRQLHLQALSAGRVQASLTVAAGGSTEGPGGGAEPAVR